MDSQMLVEETAQGAKILDAIIALETGNLDGVFYPYRPHREHLETRFGVLFYNDRIVIPEAMRSTIFAMLHNQTRTGKPTRFRRPDKIKILRRRLYFSCN